MGQINKKRFCGKSSGYSFMTARRPKLTPTGPVCELGTDQACHNGAPENQICLPKDDRDSCPITAIEIVLKDDKRQELSDWSSVDIN